MNEQTDGRTYERRKERRKRGDPDVQKASNVAVEIDQVFSAAFSESEVHGVGIYVVLKVLIEILREIAD